MPETEEGKKSTATFFAMRYNAFHAVEDQLILKSPNQNGFVRLLAQSPKVRSGQRLGIED